MRVSRIAAALLLTVAPPAVAQLPAAPPELPGFTRRKDGDGKTWWHRRAEGWDYFAAPTPEAWMHPPLTIVANNSPVSRNFGLNLEAWHSTASAPGFTSGGGVPVSVAEAETPADPSPAAEPDDLIGQFCRRYHLAREIVYAAIGLGSGLAGVLAALLLRRIFGR